MRLRTYLFICILSIAYSCKTTYVSKFDVHYARIADEVSTSDAEIESMIAPFKVQLDSIMNEEIGHLVGPLTKERPESDIGNWLADMLYDYTSEIYDGRLDLAIQNHGGIRVNSMSAGPITRGEIFEIMPFDNVISIISLRGEVLNTLLDHMARSNGWPMSASLTFDIKESRAVNILIGGRAIEHDKVYHIAMSDYMANNAALDTTWIIDNRIDYPDLVRDAFISEIKKATAAGVEIHPKKEGRIKNLDHE